MAKYLLVLALIPVFVMNPLTPYPLLVGALLAAAAEADA